MCDVAKSENRIMSNILSFRDLDAWQAAMDLVATTYALAKKLPASEQFELASQLRRAAVSVPSNVAEGHAGGTRARYLHHVRIALGSLAELETQLEIGRRLRFLPDDGLVQSSGQIARTGQLLHGLARSLRLTPPKDSSDA